MKTSYMYRSFEVKDERGTVTMHLLRDIACEASDAANAWAWAEWEPSPSEFVFGLRTEPAKLCVRCNPGTATECSMFFVVNANPNWLCFGARNFDRPFIVEEYVPASNTKEAPCG